MEQKLREAFKEILDVNELNDDVSIMSVKTWDSLNHIKLILAIQEKFGIEIETEDAIELISFVKIRKYLSEKINNE